MNILVLLKMVPDVVEELELDPGGKSLDLEFLRLIVDERDDHAMEQALLLKERSGGTVTALAIDAPEVDAVLYSAMAKGADRAIKITGVDPGITTRSVALLLSRVLPEIPDLPPSDLILGGCMAIDDLDGQIPALLSHSLKLPYVGVITGIDVGAGEATVVKEYAGGVRGEFVVPMPAILGIQAAESTPRYIPVAKVRATMKSSEIETSPSPGPVDVSEMEILQMMKPETEDHAEMLEGSDKELAEKICELLTSHGVLKEVS